MIVKGCIAVAHPFRFSLNWTGASRKFAPATVTKIAAKHFYVFAAIALLLFCLYPDYFTTTFFTLSPVFTMSTPLGIAGILPTVPRATMVPLRL